MNKLPRLVLVGLGTVAVAVLSVFSGKTPRASSPASGASIDASSYEIAGSCGGWLQPICPTHPTPTVATSVRG